MNRIIGRDKETQELNRLYNSGKAEFVAVYGRRRVGKTYLIDTFFEDRLTFRHAGLSPVDTKQGKNLLAEQLQNFQISLQRHGAKQTKKPKSWLEAFFLLEQWLETQDKSQRWVVFLDEMPWMDTPRSGFITALEAFWNGWGCRQSNLLLIVCGSASSWIQNNLINNHGGLYDRITYEIKLSPFTLKECEAFYEQKNIRLSRYDIVQAYMILGGVPYYLGYMQAGMSLAQNVDEIFFAPKAKLREEFHRLFMSVFAQPEEVKQIVKLLATRHVGFTRLEIIKALGLSGGRLTTMLRALEESDFILRYVPFGHSQKDVHYKLIDPFCLFYLRFVEGNGSENVDFWKENVASQAVSSWRGIAFEEVCLNHIRQIKRALGVEGVKSTQSSWALRGDVETEGTQIDLLIDRADNVVNLCEMKFYQDEFTIDKAYFRTLQNRQSRLLEALPKRKTVHTVLITTYGLTYNEYSGFFLRTLTLDDLFSD